MFALTSKYLPPPPGAAPPPLWGDPNLVRERLGDQVTDVAFERDTMLSPALSPQHVRAMFETTAGPVIKLVQSLKDNPAKLKEYRTELEALAGSFIQSNVIRQHFLMTRARKRS